MPKAWCQLQYNKMNTKIKNSSVTAPICALTIKQMPSAARADLAFKC